MRRLVKLLELVGSILGGGDNQDVELGVAVEKPDDKRRGDIGLANTSECLDHTALGAML